MNFDTYQVILSFLDEIQKNKLVRVCKTIKNVVLFDIYNLSETENFADVTKNKQQLFRRELYYGKFNVAKQIFYFGNVDITLSDFLQACKDGNINVISWLLNNTQSFDINGVDSSEFRYCSRSVRDFIELQKLKK